MMLTEHFRDRSQFSSPRFLFSLPLNYLQLSTPFRFLPPRETGLMISSRRKIQKSREHSRPTRHAPAVRALLPRQIHQHTQPAAPSSAISRFCQTNLVPLSNTILGYHVTSPTILRNDANPITGHPQHPRKSGFPTPQPPPSTPPPTPSFERFAPPFSGILPSYCGFPPHPARTKLLRKNAKSPVSELEVGMHYRRGV